MKLVAAIAVVGNVAAILWVLVAAMVLVSPALAMHERIVWAWLVGALLLLAATTAFFVRIVLPFAQRQWRTK